MKRLAILIVKTVALAVMFGGGVPLVAYEIQRITGIRIPGGFVAGIALGCIWIASAKLVNNYKKTSAEELLPGKSSD